MQLHYVFTSKNVLKILFLITLVEATPLLVSLKSEECFVYIRCFFIQVHLGGIDTFMQPGKTMYVRSNFTGCLENVWFNYMNIIQDTRKERERFNIHGNVMIGTCMVRKLLCLLEYVICTMHHRLKHPQFGLLWLVVCVCICNPM